MRQVIYAMRFEGKAEPVSTDGTILRATSSAPSNTLTSVVGPNGLHGDLSPTPGGTAEFESEVTFTSETHFLESGTIRFGEGNLIRFSTIDQGYVGAGAEPGLMHGSVMWRIEGGEGQLAGAVGLITSNALIRQDLSLVDHQFGVLYLPSPAA